METLYLLVIGYFAAAYLAGRVLRVGRQDLTAEEKVLLADSATNAPPIGLVPPILGMAILFVGPSIWPRHSNIVVVAAFLAVLVAEALVSLASWRRIAALGVRNTYLRHWTIAQSVRFSAVFSVLAYFLYDYVRPCG
jgi:hypothetical protein